MKILILGGYGTFGGRLAHLLAPDSRVELIIAGRSAQKARAFSEGLPRGAGVRALSFDRDGDVEGQIGQIGPDLLVDASGPFQTYGDDPYRVVKACLARGTDYMDLADGSEFVKGIRRFDQQAKSNGLYVLSGVSSFPVLTAAVVRRLSRGMTNVKTIRGGIAPSPYAGVGLNVIRALASYAGKPITLCRDGQRAQAYALTETMRYTICPPGRLPLPNTLFSLVDVPDLQVLPELWPEVETMWLGAGPVPEVLHRMLIGMARLVRVRVLPTLSPFAPLFHAVINNLRWGPHRGGMFVSVEGLGQAGERLAGSWHLLAERGDGPYIPSMAAQAVILRSLDGKRPAAGARPATGDLELEDYEALFEKMTIYTGQRESRPGSGNLPLYKRLLDGAYDQLPAPLAEMHNFTTKEILAEGMARVRTGRSPQARLIHALFGFPKAAEDVRVRVRFHPENGGERWERDFAGRRFSSFQWQGTGRDEHLLMEKFGPITIALALVWEDEKLKLLVRGWKLLGLPLPAFLAPGGATYEYELDGLFCFHVEIRHWLTGLIVEYEGQLKPVN